MTYRLAGNIEQANIELVYTKNCAIGSLNDEKILVSNANRYQGTSCLVRFTLHDYDHDQGKLPISSFISSQIPENFQSLKKEKYILVGQWPSGVNKNGLYPSIKDIYNIYSPGNMSVVAFFADGDSKRHGRFIITRSGTYEVKQSPSDIVKRKLPHPSRFVRAMIFESRERLKELSDYILNRNLTPLEMEPLR